MTTTVTAQGINGSRYYAKFEYVAADEATNETKAMDAVNGYLNAEADPYAETEGPRLLITLTAPAGIRTWEI